MRTLSLKLPDALHASLTVAAEQTGKTKSILVREALEAYLRHRAEIPTGSCHDLAGKYAGCVAGPRDLSYGARHMRGYGR